MKKDYVRQVVVFEDHFKEFRKTLDRDTLRKLYQVLTLIMMVEVVPIKFLKAIVADSRRRHRRPRLSNWIRPKR